MTDNTMRASGRRAGGNRGNGGLTEAGFAALGLGQIAYVKRVKANGEPAYALYGADGRALAVLQDRERVVSVIRQKDLHVLSIH